MQAVNSENKRRKNIPAASSYKKQKKHHGSKEKGGRETKKYDIKKKCQKSRFIGMDQKPTNKENSKKFNDSQVYFGSHQDVASEKCNNDIQIKKINFNVEIHAKILGYKKKLQQ